MRIIEKLTMDIEGQLKEQFGDLPVVGPDLPVRVKLAGDKSLAD